MIVHHVSLASFVTKLVWKTQLVTAQVVGIVYVEHGLKSRLMLVLLDTAILSMELVVSVPILRQEGSVSLDFFVLRVHESQHHA